MKVFVVYWHPEPRSFNAAMFDTARETLATAGHEVRTSDLHRMGFDPVSGRKNFKTVKDADYLKLQIEEIVYGPVRLTDINPTAIQAPLCR